jgi:hypothetical protein
MTSLTEPDTRNEPEEIKVEKWRCKELIRVGFDATDALTIAARHSGPGAIDLHYALDLVSKGCDPKVAADILI